MNEAQIKGLAAQAAESSPLGRTGTTEDVASAVVFWPRNKAATSAAASCSWTAARRRSERVLRFTAMSAVVARIGLGLLLCACKPPAPAPIEHPANVAPAAPAEPEAAPVTQTQHPVRDPFELDDESDDPAAALESMKHNCCDEMPAEEIRAHSD